MKYKWDLAGLPILFFAGLWISDSCMAPIWVFLFGPVRDITINSNLGFFELYIIQMSGMASVCAILGRVHRAFRPGFYSGALRPLIFPVFNAIGAFLYYELWNFIPMGDYVYHEVAGDEAFLVWLVVTALASVFPISQVVIYYAIRWMLKKATLP